MKKKVLLVDDDFAVLAGLAGVLVSEDYDVIHAADTTEAIERFRKEYPFDIVLLDLNMPGKNGWYAFEQITSVDPLIPVIVITARPDQYQTAIAAGVGALMEKPLDLPVLLQTMENLMHESAQERLARRTGRNASVAYCPAPTKIEGEVFGQVMNRAKVTRRLADRVRGNKTAASSRTDEPLDRLIEAWRQCTEEDRRIFLRGLRPALTGEFRDSLQAELPVPENNNILFHLRRALGDRPATAS